MTGWVASKVRPAGRSGVHVFLILTSFIVIHPSKVSADGWVGEMNAAVLREAWDYNIRDEDAAMVTGGLFYRWSRHWATGIELAAIGVHQEQVPSVVAGGFSLIVRWQRTCGRGRCFADAGGGLSYASDQVPEDGTRFNYLAQSAVGVSRPWSERAQLTYALVWLHISNNGLAGRSRNPDIQALGARVGVSVALWGNPR